MLKNPEAQAERDRILKGIERIECQDFIMTSQGEEMLWTPKEVALVKSFKKLVMNDYNGD